MDSKKRKFEGQNGANRFPSNKLHYSLPQELIAQHPVTLRDASRLLVVNRQNQSITHRIFRDLPEYLIEGDCLVLNETRVMPFRLFGEKRGGGARIEILLLEQTGKTRWIALAQRARRLREGTEIVFGDDAGCEVVRVLGGGRFELDFDFEGDFFDLLDRYGQTPLPPYIERPEGTTLEDRERYQTVYASIPGSSAAPTAGLHFTPEVFDALHKAGIETARVVLHVGPDTFRPLSTEYLDEHQMHSERFQVNAITAKDINNCRQKGGRIVAIGTTAVRTLESTATEGGEVVAQEGATDLFITPGYRFKAVDALITNFHLPRSTLLALVAAFMGEDLWKKAYEEAIQQRYRFYSYGDAMLIL